MDTALALLFDGNGGQVVVIWLLLILSALIALFALALPRGVRKPRQVSAWLAGNANRKREQQAARDAEADETIRYAEEITVAARGAAATAERRREQCQQAQERVERAWAAYRDADAALDRARRAAAYAAPVSIPTPAERAESLRRSAQVAYRRGDLSDGQLLDALTHRNGWDPQLHPVEQELILARAAVGHRNTAYQQALDAENAAWRASDIATAAVRSLRQEVAAANALAEAARATRTDPQRPAADRRRVPAHA